MISEYSFCKVTDSKTMNKALVFIPYPYLFERHKGHIFGKCIYVTGHKEEGFRVRQMQNDAYVVLKEKIEKNQLVVTADSKMDAIFRKCLPNAASKVPEDDLFIDKLSCIKMEFISELYTPKEGLREYIREDKGFRKNIENCCALLRIGLDRLALTGSLLLYRPTKIDDVDLVVYTDPNEARELRKRIAKIRETKGKPPQKFGISWPLQYLGEDDTTICLFIAYSKVQQSPLYGYNLMKCEEGFWRFEGKVIDDTHAAFAPTILGIDSSDKRVLILGTACRGFFQRGSYIKGVGRMVNLRIKEESSFFLVNNPWKQIEVPPFQRREGGRLSNNK